MISTLAVGPPLPVLRESAFIRLDAPATNLLSGFNPQLLEGTGEVRVRLSSTRLVLLGEPMRQLLAYPYGCAEQTASSTLPWVILRQSPELLPLVEKSAAEANAALEAGVERLLKMQTRSWGLAYWPGGSEPALWASTHGAVVLGLPRGTGAVVPENQWNDLLTYLSGALRNGSLG